MSQSTYTSVVLAKRPKALIVPGETFSLKQNPMLSQRDLKDGQILVETLYLSIDPAMRGWLNDIRSYIPPVQIGEVMRGAGTAKVLASKSTKFLVGDYVSATPGWSEVAIVAENDASLLEVPEHAKLTDFLGVLGIPGLTAYFGMLDIAKVKTGDFVVVSGAAGATGSVACQIAKLKGATVLGLAGSDEKVTWLKNLGCDALNYKRSDFKKAFKEKTKNLIDVFFDNVGGEILEVALSRANLHSRYVLCGAVSQYNSSKPVGPKNIGMAIAMRMTLRGFIIFDYESQYNEARKELAKWMSEGKVQRKETIVKGGLKSAEEALLGLYTGINTGKLLVEVKADNDRGGSKL
ncbi:hypothetical protein ACEPPN_001025 [Leptodophora sp. 'Broadleaf-Isolate-01']